MTRTILPSDRSTLELEDHGFALLDHPCSSIAAGRVAAGTLRVLYGSDLCLNCMPVS